MMRLNVPDQTYQPPAQQHYGPPAEYVDYPRPAKYRRKRKKQNPQREMRARRISGLFMLFIASWIPTAFGWPGLTILIWGAGFSFMLYRWLR